MKPPRFCLAVALLAATPLGAQELPLDSLLRIPVSSAAKYSQTISQAAASVTIITAEDIRRYGYRTLDELLRRVPGYHVSYDRNYAYIGVHGFGRPGDYNNRVLLMIDGHTLNEGVFGMAPAGSDLGLDLDAIERVEVVHGPGSALYGTGAMLTSINIVTFTGRGLNGARAAVSAGSFGSRGVALQAGGELGRRVEASVAAQATDVEGQDLYFPEFDDSTSNFGVARGLDWERHRSVLVRLLAGRFGVSAFGSTRSKGIPTAAFGMAFNDPRASTRDERRFLEARYASDPARSAQLDLRTYFSHYAYYGAYPGSGGLYEDASLDEALGAEARLRWDTGTRNRLLIGGEFQRHVRAAYRAWDVSDQVYFDRSTPFTVFSVYAQNEWAATGSLSVIAGLRHDIQEGIGATSPRVALVFHPGARTTVKALYGEAFRAPNSYERWYETDDQKMSVGLRAERIRTYEAVWEQRIGPAVYLSASVHEFRMRDLIDTYLDPADSLLQFANRALAVSTGATLALDARLPGGDHAYLSYGYQDARDGSTRAWLSNSPRHLVQAGASLGVTGHARLSGEAHYESGRLTVTGGTTDPFLRTGLNLIVTPGRLGAAASPQLLRRTELALGVSNLLATRIRTPGGFEHAQTALEQDGRSISARLRVRL